MGTYITLGMYENPLNLMLQAKVAKLSIACLLTVEVMRTQTLMDICRFQVASASTVVFIHILHNVKARTRTLACSLFLCRSRRTLQSSWARRTALRSSELFSST